ncbi:CAP domain-containing protein [Asanoa sp. NPDC049573]|uniref:CAP domain-containing protein n=1 Tax=Asanoa sp. NPDC049573 TaxID=3155396 RepID=UPI00341E367A
MQDTEHAGTGKHRDPRRTFGPLGLAFVVMIILGGLGAGAAFLPSSFVGAAKTSTQGAIAGPGDGAFDTDSSGVEDGPDSGAYPDETLSEPSPTPPVASPTATAKPKPTARRTTTAPKRTMSSPAKRSTSSGSTVSTSGAGGTEQAKVVAETNRQRAMNGCGPVTVNAKLTKAAQSHSVDQAQHNTMSHDGSDGSTPWDRSKAAGYDNAIGENVAMGYRDAAAVMDGWMNSPGHRANILNCSAKAIGVGLAKASDGSPYWTQMFGSVA